MPERPEIPEDDHRLRIALEQIATGRASGATPAENWQICRDIAAEALAPFYPLQRRIEFLEEALQAVRGAEPPGLWLDVYKEAGGGYEGLQAIAKLALEDDRG